MASHLLDDKQKVDTFGCVTMVTKHLESPACGSQATNRFTSIAGKKNTPTADAFPIGNR